MNNSYILLGGNSGDREASLEAAIHLIKELAGRVVRQSSIYETEPWGFFTHERFLNQVILIQTSLTPAVLLSKLITIEKKLGRQRNNEGYSSRSIDLDILFFNDKIINSEKLQIPHPRMQFRKFVLIPMSEIAGDFIHPGLKMNIDQLITSCPDNLEVRLFKECSEFNVN